MKPLTIKQKQILDFINDFVKQKGYSPSYMEIAKKLEVSSPATIHQHIKALERKGYLKGNHHQKRALEPVVLSGYHDSLVIDLPMAGLIAAGEPIEAIETNETMSMPRSLVIDPDNSFILKVKGQSMIDDGIWDGDFVIVQRNCPPKDGDVVVALLNDTYATLKKFFKEDNRIRLQPANEKLKPIYCKNPLIQGIVRAVVRKFV